MFFLLITSRACLELNPSGNGAFPVRYRVAGTPLAACSILEADYASYIVSLVYYEVGL